MADDQTWGRDHEKAAFFELEIQQGGIGFIGFVPMDMARQLNELATKRKPFSVSKTSPGGSIGMDACFRPDLGGFRLKLKSQPMIGGISQFKQGEGPVAPCWKTDRIEIDPFDPLAPFFDSLSVWAFQTLTMIGVPALIEDLKAPWAWMQAEFKKLAADAKAGDKSDGS